MDLYPQALVTVARCAEILTLEDDIHDLVPYINYASAAISLHCSRRFVRAAEALFLDSYGDGRLVIPNKPLITVTDIHYDTARLFILPETLETDYFVDAAKGVILLAFIRERNEKVFLANIISGYSRIAFSEQFLPDAPDPVAGDVWQHPDGSLTEYDGAAWVEHIGVAMPFDLEAACAEYAGFLKTRLKTGMAGIMKRERGYSFEGSAIDYEKTMPTHVRDKLAGYVNYGI